ncbi:unnamed protein product [Closterium sp. NIES-53]
MILTGSGFLGDLCLHSHAEIPPPTEPVRPPLAPFPLHEGVENLHELPRPLLQAADGHRGSLASPVEQSLIHLDLHRAVPQRPATTVHALPGRVDFLEEISGMLPVGEALAVDATLASQSAHRHRHIQLRDPLQLLGASIGLTLVVVGLHLRHPAAPRHQLPSRAAQLSRADQPSRAAQPSRATLSSRAALPSRAALRSRTSLHSPTASAATAASAPTAAMTSPTVLTFDAEGRAVDFDVWVDDLQLFLQCDSRDGVSLFDHTSGVSTAPAATADSTVRSQWTTRDAVARLAVRSHLPPAECAHFGQYKTAQSLYDAVVARYSSPATAALSRLMLPYLFRHLCGLHTSFSLWGRDLSVTSFSTSSSWNLFGRDDWLGRWSCHAGRAMSGQLAGGWNVGAKQADVEGGADVPVSGEEEVGGDRCDHVADAKWPAISRAEFRSYGQAEVLGVEQN